MPLRHPQTPHPLGLIVARGMKESFTSIGMDPHSRALTVLIAGDVSIHRIITVFHIFISLTNRNLKKQLKCILHKKEESLKFLKPLVQFLLKDLLPSVLFPVVP